MLVVAIMIKIRYMTWIRHSRSLRERTTRRGEANNSQVNRQGRDKEGLSPLKHRRLIGLRISN